MALEQRITEAIEKAKQTNEFRLLGDGNLELTEAQTLKLIAFLQTKPRLKTFIISLSMGNNTQDFVFKLFNYLNENNDIEKLKFRRPIIVMQ